MKKLQMLLIFLGFILTVSTSFNIIFASNPNFPEWKTGNWWNYNVEYEIDNVNYLGTQKVTIINENFDLFQNGQNFNCYQIQIIAGGTIYGELGGSGVTGTWTTTEEHYYTKSDISYVEIKSSYEETISVDDSISSIIQNEVSLEIIQDINYNPPFEANKGFPLKVGKSWSAATTETVKSDITNNGNSESTTESEAYTKTFLVTGKESISSSIGEIETFVIKRTDPDGTYGETYYSPEVGTDVKVIEYDSTGKIVATFDLIDFEYESNPNILNFVGTQTFMILIIILGIVVSVIIIIYVLKKKKLNHNSESIVT